MSGYFFNFIEAVIVAVAFRIVAYLFGEMAAFMSLLAFLALILFYAAEWGE